MIPHFVGIGTREAALPVLMKLIAAHPAVSDSVPSLNFFGTEAVQKKGIHWYEEVLRTGANARLIGEWSQEYFANPLVPAQIAEMVPEAKLIAIVRNPIERVVAEYERVKTAGAGLKYRTCGEFIRRHQTIQACGLYGRHLRKFSEFYSPLDLKVIVYDDFVANPYKVLMDAYKFLELDPYTPSAVKLFAPPPDDPINPGLIKRTVIGSVKLYKHWHPPQPPKLFDTPPPLDTRLTPEEITGLTRLYREDIALLSQFLHRDLQSEWNAGE